MDMTQCHYLLNNSSYPFMQLCIHGGLWYWSACSRQRWKPPSNRDDDDGPWCFHWSLLVNCWERWSFSLRHQRDGRLCKPAHCGKTLCRYHKNSRHFPTLKPVFGWWSRHLTFRRLASPPKRNRRASEWEEEEEWDWSPSVAQWINDLGESHPSTWQPLGVDSISNMYRSFLVSVRVCIQP